VERKSSPLPGFELRLLGCPDRSQSLYRLRSLGSIEEGNGFLNIVAYRPVARQRPRNKQQDNGHFCETASYIRNSTEAVARQLPSLNNGSTVGSGVFYHSYM
jgi:hypothetical protein